MSFLMGRSMVSIVSDWSTLYLQVECDVDVEENGKRVLFRVTCTHVKSLSTSSLDAFLQKTVSEEPTDLLTALEVCLKSHLIDSGRFFDADRRFFAYPNNSTVRAVDLQGGMELWMGFTQSIKITERRCMLNLYVTPLTANPNPNPNPLSLTMLIPHPEASPSALQHYPN